MKYSSYHVSARLLTLLLTVSIALSVAVNAQTNIWQGIQSTDWHNPCNWSRAEVPTKDHLVQIPNAPRYPVVTAVAHCNDLEISSSNSSALTINSSGGGSLCLDLNGFGSCSGNPTNNGGCPITATFSYAPSQDNPGVMDPSIGTFTQLLHVTNPSSTSEISKRLAAVVHNISGGTGGPYTINFSNVNYTLNSFSCAGNSRVTGVDLRWYGPTFGPPQLASQANNGSFPANAIVTGVSGTDYAWCGATAVWNSVPRYQSTVIHTLSGSLTITDGGGGPLTIQLPGGNEGATNGSPGTYRDTWPINITNTICP